MGGEINPLLHLEKPEDLAHVWEWFLELSNRRAFLPGGFPGRLQHTEILAWMVLTGTWPSRREALLILTLDDVFIEVAAEKDDVVMVPATPDAVARILDERIERDKKGGLK